jgi:AcrR family transcriptional regulator
MNGETRKYRKQRRADLEEETRLRITVSALDLHGTVGPSQTSISAVARRAGVRRSTVYRHFPDETALFRACSAHWAAQNPRPDLQVWAGIASPNERLEVALIELYGFFHRTERMLDNLFRDETTVPAVRQQFRGFRGYLQQARDVLTAGRGLRGDALRRTQGAIGHAVAFSTWKSLVREQRLSDVEAAALMASAVSSAAGAKGRIRRVGLQSIQFSSRT